MAGGSTVQATKVGSDEEFVLSVVAMAAGGPVEKHVDRHSHLHPSYVVLKTLCLPMTM